MRYICTFFYFQVDKAFYGPVDTTPVDHQEKAFKDWMKQRCPQKELFKKWLKDKLPIKAFFPFVTHLLNAEIVHFFRSEDGERHGGVLPSQNKCMKSEPERKQNERCSSFFNKIFEYKMK